MCRAEPTTYRRRAPAPAAASAGTPQQLRSSTGRPGGAHGERCRGRPERCDLVDDGHGEDPGDAADGTRDCAHRERATPPGPDR